LGYQINRNPAHQIINSCCAKQKKGLFSETQNQLKNKGKRKEARLKANLASSLSLHATVPEIKPPIHANLCTMEKKPNFLLCTH
jgi:hypothetical protein